MIRSESITYSLEGQIMDKCPCVINAMVNCDCSPDWIQSLSKALIRHVCSFRIPVKAMGAEDEPREARHTLRMGDITPRALGLKRKKKKKK